MHCIKLLGDKLTARSFPSQVNEIHARMAVLNKFTELGRPSYPSCLLNLSSLRNSAFQTFMQQSRYEKATKATKNATELSKLMQKQYPTLQSVDSLELGAKVVKVKCSGHNLMFKPY